MLRTRLSDALKTAMKGKDAPTVSTLRLIMAALKDRDIAARGKGNKDDIPEEEILGLLQSMIKQRRDSIALYEKAAAWSWPSKRPRKSPSLRSTCPNR
ncbi:MAG: hypothetical protein CFH02_01573 [Alphaproteobacteria bacterium MarineAlpha3_Bin1]|nr:MAG: hypothetical protein CFH02_01573 [Alphaproteobacteria bacterium MarineAlpha3_Bin1]